MGRCSTRRGVWTLLFGRGKKKISENPSTSAPEERIISRLQELSGGDEELYSALARLMFLDPKKILSPLENILNEAQEYEVKGNKLRAEVGYRIAGGVSLYRGDVEGVRKYFSKASSFSGEERFQYKVVAKRAEEAVAVAKKFYGDL